MPVGTTTMTYTSSPTPSAGSSDAPQRQRKPRTSKPKVKTGCTNCKYVGTTTNPVLLLPLRPALT
jgi:hypothetical protein